MLGKAKAAGWGRESGVEYKSLGQAENLGKASDPQGTRASDIADTAVGANRGRQIVRIERGVINRAGYVITMLHDPAAGDPHPHVGPRSVRGDPTR